MIKRPYISEKSMSLAKGGLYTFEVTKSMNKLEIAALIKNKFNVDVMFVRVINTPKRRKLQRSRKGYFNVSGIKKALIQVKKGQKIPLFETSREAEVTTAETGPKVLSEKKSLLKGTKVKVETGGKAQASKEKPKKAIGKTSKQKSIEKKKGKK